MDSGFGYDFIVVGGGTAGAIVARRLAERSPLLKVCLLEAGASDEGEDVVLDYSRWAELLKGPRDWDYSIEPQKRSNSKMRHSRGKMLGGCSSHNSVIAFLTPDNDLKKWASLVGPTWGPSGCTPFLEKLQQKITLTTVEPLNELNGAFVAAAKEAGYQEARFNSKSFREEFAESVGYFQLNAIGRTRCSSSVAYLHPLSALPSNLTILTNTIAIKVLFDEDNNARAVVTQHGQTLQAKREIVICAGAFDSPKLLLLSGIGPAWHLRDLDIPLVANVPGVGSHLLDHPEGVLIYETTKPIPLPMLQRYEVGLFVNTDKNPCTKDGPDIMFHFGLEAFDMNTLPAGYPTHKNAISLTPNVARAISEGTVRLKSSDWKDPPVIDSAYFTDPKGQDEESMLAAIKIARSVVSMPSLKPWIKRELAPGSDVKSERDLSEYLRKTNNTVYHPAGTCKIGRDDDPMAVVDVDLKVKGVQRLRVADASCFPSMVSVNPCLTVMMIAEKCADLLLKEYPIPCHL